MVEASSELTAFHNDDDARSKFKFVCLHKSHGAILRTFGAVRFVSVTLILERVYMIHHVKSTQLPSSLRVSWKVHIATRYSHRK